MGLIDKLILGRTEGTPEPEDHTPNVTPPARTAAAREVTPVKGITIPAVYRAVSILATAGSQLPLEAWDGDLKLKNQPDLLKRPDVAQSRARFVKRSITSLALHGNAYWRIFKGTDGSAAKVLRTLSPAAMTIEVKMSGRRVYKFAGDQFAKATDLTDSNVRHLKMLEVPGHAEGFGPIQACREALAGIVDLRAFADEWFNTGNVPTGVLTSDQQLNPDVADAMRKRWNDAMAGRRDVAVLGRGLTYSPVFISPEDAQFLESQQFSVAEVARMFGIPAAYLLAAVEGSNLTYENLEQIDTQLVRYTLMQYLSEIEEAFDGLLGDGITARFNLDAFLRPDAKTEAEIDAIYLGQKVLTPDEVRTRKGYTS